MAGVTGPGGSMAGAGPPRFFDRLDPSGRAALLELGTARSYPRGAFLFHEGDDTDFVILVLEGLVKLSVTSGAGREIVLAVQEPGDLAGHLAAFDDELRSRPGSAIALEPVRARVFTADEFRSFLSRRQPASHALLQDLARALRDAMQQWKEVGSHDTLGRVVDRLVELAEEHGEPDPEGLRIMYPLSQAELASWVGSSREAVVRALASLRARGLITTQRRSIVVSDLDALRREAAAS